MKIKIKKLDERARIPEKLTSDADFCYDVYAVGEPEIINGCIYCYRTGLSFEIDRESVKGTPFENAILSIDGRARSSIFKTGLILCNGTGTIDEPYRGEVKFMFYHVEKSLEPYHDGDRIGQIKLGITLPIEFVETTVLTTTERADNGFGHSGK